MIVWKYTLILLSMAACIQSWASTWYTRPVGAEYGNGDGRGYENAWQGFYRVKAFAREGDTVIVCGTHRETLIIRKSNVTIDMDCPDDPAIILGSDDYSDAAWEGPDANGEYFRAFATKPHVIAMDDNILFKGTAGSLRSGQWAVTDSRPYKVYLKDNPAGHRLEVGQRAFGIQLGESDKDVIHGVTIQGGGKAWIKYVGAGNRYRFYGRGISAFYDSWPHANWGGTWTIEGVNFYGIEEQAIHTNGLSQSLASTPDNIIVRNCRVLENGAEGIYLKGIFGSGLVENNIIGDWGHNKFGWDGVGFGDAYDGDGIDLGGGPKNASKNITVRGNTIANIRGNGIVAVAGNVTIEGNIIEGPNSWNEPAHKACIVVDPVYPEPTHVRRNVCKSTYSDGFNVRGAVAARADMLLSSNLVVLSGPNNGRAAVRHSSLNGYKAHYFNNTFVGGEYGIYWSTATESPANADAVNNIFSGQEFPLYMLPTHASSINVHNNLFWPSGMQTEPYKVDGLNYRNEVAMESQRPAFHGNLAGNPLFRDVTSGDYRLSADSPAATTGTKWWSGTPPLDLNGKPLPSEGINMGAFQ